MSTTTEQPKNHLDKLNAMIETMREDYVKTFEKKNVAASRRLRASAQEVKLALQEMRNDALAAQKS